MARTRIGMGLVGAGFVGPHHVDAVRRLGFVDVVAVAGSTVRKARAAAARLDIDRSYGDYESLLNDRSVDVIHVATPNHLHFEMVAAALAKGKHVVCEKPLAMTSAQALSLRHAARRAGVVHAVMFNYRGSPLVQHARTAIARGDLGSVHFVHGQYLQDWLLYDADYSWRLDPAQGGSTSALADIGSHWCDLAEHITGLRIVEVLGEMTTVVKRRRKPAATRHAFGRARSVEQFEWVDVPVEDLASALFRFENGAHGSVSIGQVCAGHKNDLMLEVSGASGSIRWQQERQNELWIGRRDQANHVLQKDPSLMVDTAKPLARLPGGHQEGWADAFANVIRDIYAAIAKGRHRSGRRRFYASFDDGHRAVRIVEAIAASARAGGVWTRV